MSSLPKLNLTAIFDILVVAFIIYQLLMIVRGTRAGHILLGILTMVLVYGIAVWAGLEALRSLLSYIVPYTAIAVIILFQSEIRRTNCFTATSPIVSNGPSMLVSLGRPGGGAKLSKPQIDTSCGMRTPRACSAAISA